MSKSDTEFDITRFSVSLETHAVLEAISDITGQDINAICRELAERWASEKLHEVTLIQEKLDKKRAERSGGEWQRAAETARTAAALGDTRAFRPRVQQRGGLT